MALHKVQIMARDTSTTNEDYINLTDHKLAVDIGTTPDTAAGDLASMSASLGTIQADLGTVQADIALMKADIASISGIHLGNGGVITHNSTSQIITVPATAKSVRLATKGGATNFEIDAVGDASANSPGYIPEEAIDYYPITGGSMTLKVYGTAGCLYYYFLG